jgi:hypothetical protein
VDTKFCNTKFHKILQQKFSFVFQEIVIYYFAKFCPLRTRSELCFKSNHKKCATDTKVHVKIGSGHVLNQIGQQQKSPTKLCLGNFATFISKISQTSAKLSL